MTIHKTFYGAHIDLSKIVQIRDAYLLPPIGYEGWSVGFSIVVQLRDQCIEYMRRLTEAEQRHHDNAWRLKMLDGSEVVGHKAYDVQANVLAVANLQVQIDELVEAWKASKHA